MDIEQNLALFQELICCGDSVYTWRYDAAGALLSSNCPHEELFGEAFSFLGCLERALAIGQGGGLPQIVGTAFGLIWGVDFVRRDEKLEQMLVIGPAFSHNVSARDIESGFVHYAGQQISLAWKHRLIRTYEEVPVVQHILFTRYLLMLHYCLTGEKLDASDTTISQSFTSEAPPDAGRDRHRIWMAERALLDMVRTGDLNYRAALNHSILLSEGVPVSARDPLRQAKTSVTVFISLVCRAAIEGGLSPEEAYSLGDFYIQSAENAKTLDELSAIPGPMYDDFIRRVHRCRTNPKLSPAVQKCCDYIEMNLTEKVRASDLAALAGYSEYYITRKFKEETGYFINDYVKFAKIERAKVLLQNTDLSVLEIAEQLGFTTRSYFGRSFREVAGMSPTQFREQCVRSD